MFEGILLVVGLLMAVFAGVNIGGSSTGVAFGPAVGSQVISKTAAAGLMTAFAFLGGSTAGREIIKTLSQGIVPSDVYTLTAAVVILFFLGVALLISNLFGVPASTSMTVVSAIAGMGAATGTLRWGVLGGIVSWWLVAPIIAFWVCAVIGRYCYPYLEVWFTFDRSEGPLLTLDRKNAIPVPRLSENTTYRELTGNVLVIAIACYMAFSAGASNYGNAIGPLVGNGVIRMNTGIGIAAIAVGLGAFTIARRTIDTVGNDLTELPILAALIVETVSATIISLLSSAGIPASLAVSATMCIIGLGWGRATRSVSVPEVAKSAIHHREENAEQTNTGESSISVDSLTADIDEVADVGEKSSSNTTQRELFDPASTGRIIMLWLLAPTLSMVGSYLVFELSSIIY